MRASLGAASVISLVFSICDAAGQTLTDSDGPVIATLPFTQIMALPPSAFRSTAGTENWTIPLDVQAQVAKNDAIFGNFYEKKDFKLTPEQVNKYWTDYQGESKGVFFKPISIGNKPDQWIYPYVLDSAIAKGRIFPEKASNILVVDSAFYKKDISVYDAVYKKAGDCILDKERSID